MVHVPKFGRFVNLEKTFWNNMFEELPKYKDMLDAIFTPQLLLETINVNTSFCHVFNHL
jgi:hypothetical protein